MSTIPSIAMIPSGYKANKVYSVLPTDGAADLTFARTSSANRVNSDNLIEEVATGVPRLDYTDGACPSLLLEPQSTNLITYPLSFDNAYWTKSGASVTGGFSAPSVDNPTSAFKLVEDTSTSTHYIKAINLFVSDSTDRVHSIYLKPINTRYIAIGSGTDFNNNNNTLIFDTQLGVWSLNSSTNGIGLDSSVDTNGWWRIKIKSNSASGAYDNFMIGTANGGTSYTDATFTGDGVSGFYLFGAQLEQQSFATSLMLPNTEGSTVTRVSETVSKTGLASYINSEEGTLYFKGNGFSNGGIDRRICLSDGTSSNRVFMSFSATNDSFSIGISANGSTVFQSSIDASIDHRNTLKIAFVYKSGVSKLYINDTEVLLKSEAFTISNLSVLNLGNFNNSSSIGNLNYQDLRVYKTALTPTQIANL